jgi:hypothetical protein
MTGGQVLWKVEVPLGLPLLIGGIRSATLQVVATVTIATYVGLGGLGFYIIQGIQLRDTAQILGASILVVALALVLDGVFASPAHRRAARRRRPLRPAGGDPGPPRHPDFLSTAPNERHPSCPHCAPPASERAWPWRPRRSPSPPSPSPAAAPAAPSSSPPPPAARPARPTITIGSQAYYSNEIIAEIYAQALEGAGFTVDRKFNIGQRDAIIPSLQNGTIR